MNLIKLCIASWAIIPNAIQMEVLSKTLHIYIKGQRCCNYGVYWAVPLLSIVGK